MKNFLYNHWSTILGLICGIAVSIWLHSSFGESIINAFTLWLAAGK